jgi:acid phosphatase family membrane protein YuiD
MIVSPYIIAGAAGWVVAQGAKYILNIGKKNTGGRRDTIQGLYISGGMPSAHSATVMAVTTYIGLNDGFDSGLFGLAILMACIVMYDAMMVRRSSGLQGEAIVTLTKAVKLDVKLPRFAKGHQPSEVFVGAIVGVIIGLVVFFATK